MTPFDTIKAFALDQFGAAVARRDLEHPSVCVHSTMGISANVMGRDRLQALRDAIHALGDSDEKP